MAIDVHAHIFSQRLCKHIGRMPTVHSYMVLESVAADVIHQGLEAGKTSQKVCLSIRW